VPGGAGGGIEPLAWGGIVAAWRDGGGGGRGGIEPPGRGGGGGIDPLGRGGGGGRAEDGGPGPRTGGGGGRLSGGGLGTDAAGRTKGGGRDGFETELGAAGCVDSLSTSAVISQSESRGGGAISVSESRRGRFGRSSPFIVPRRKQSPEYTNCHGVRRCLSAPTGT
jgi:hypothetical protein